MNRSRPPPNVGPYPLSQRIPFWFLVPLSGSRVGLAPEGLTTVNKKDSLQYFQLLEPKINKHMHDSVSFLTWNITFLKEKKSWNYCRQTLGMPRIYISPNYLSKVNYAFTCAGVKANVVHYDTLLSKNISSLSGFAPWKIRRKPMTACGYYNKLIIFNNGEKCRRIYKLSQLTRNCVKEELIYCFNCI